MFAVLVKPPDEQVDVNGYEWLLVEDSLHREPMGQDAAHSAVILEAGSEQVVLVSQSRERFLYVFGFRPFAVAVGILPRVGMDEGELVIGNPHDWAVFVMKPENVFVGPAANLGYGIADSAHCPCLGTGEATQGVEDDVVQGLSADICHTLKVPQDHQNLFS